MSNVLTEVEPQIFFLVERSMDEHGEVECELLGRKLNGRTPEECAVAIEIEFAGHLRWLDPLPKEKQIADLNALLGKE